MKVALYLRRSTNERLQADSLRVQESVLREYARHHAMTVVEVYRDSASGTTTKHRKAFLQMVETITHGAPFEAVLVRDVSRFGRFYDPDEAAFFEVLFLGHDVKTIYAEEVFGSDTTPMAGLLKSVRRVMASEYSKDKSRLVRAGQIRAVRQGFLPGGKPGYGLTRAMVGMDGKILGTLNEGEWKSVSNRRILLVPGSASEVAVVRRIFTQYAEEGLTVAEIVRRLNAEKIPAPLGARWSPPFVSSILRNPRYVGVVSYQQSTSCGAGGEEPDRPIEGANPHGGVVDRETWQRCRERRASQVRYLTREVLAQDLRVAYERHGCVERRMLKKLPRPLSHGPFDTKFERGLHEALELAFRGEIERRRTVLTRLLQASFDLTSDAEGWVIDRRLRISFRPAFRHRRRWSEPWLIDASGIAGDLVVSFGIPPDMAATESFFLTRRSQIEARSSRWLRGITQNEVSLNELVRRLEVFRRSGLVGVEESFLEAARAHGAVNFRSLARELGWPAHSVRRVYWRLAEKGEWLPPLMKAAGRRIEIVCGRCGKTRSLSLRLALARKTDLCGPCARRTIRLRVTIRCPSCRRETSRLPSQVRKLSNGPDTVCRWCLLARTKTFPGDHCLACRRPTP